MRVNGKLREGQTEKYLCWFSNENDLIGDLDTGMHYYKVVGDKEKCKTLLQKVLHNEDPNKNFDFSNIIHHSSFPNGFYGIAGGDESDEYMCGIEALDSLDYIVEAFGDRMWFKGFSSKNEAMRYIEDQTGADPEEILWEDNIWFDNSTNTQFTLLTNFENVNLDESKKNSRTNRIVESKLFEAVLNLKEYNFVNY